MPEEMPKQGKSQLVNLAILLVLLAGLSFVLVHFNIVSCGFYSSLGCDTYYSIVAGGKPKVLIVYGDSGMGDPQLMYDTLRSSKFSAIVYMKPIELTTMPVLAEHQLVIVEHSRKIKASQMKMFMEYAARGGRIVWIGDAGTQATEGETDMNNFLLKGQRKTGASKEEYIGPWARKQGDKQVSLDYMLGVDFKANYCELTQCKPGYVVGNLEFQTNDDRLTSGLSQALPFYGDFSIVETNPNAYQKSVGVLNYGTSLIASPPQEYFWLKKESTSFGKEFPVILASGAGGRVAYYAFPPEYLVSGQMPTDKQTGERIAYWAVIENMYYGMLYK